MSNNIRKNPFKDLMKKDRLSEWERTLLGRIDLDAKSQQAVTWTAKSPLNRPRWGLKAFTIDQKIWVVGGLYDDGSIADIEVYDPATDIWTAIPNPFSTFGQAFVAHGNGKIYAVGGLSSCDTLNTIVEEYDPSTNTLTQKADLPGACYQPGIAAGLNGKIYIMGGCVPPAGLVGVADRLDTVQEYDPLTDTWVVKKAMLIPRSTFCAITAANGRIYALGGYATGGYTTDRVDVYNPATDIWRPKAPMPYTRSCFAAVHAGSGMIYALGGLGNRWPRYVDEFDYVNNIWTSKEQFPRDDSSRWYLGATIMGNKIYVIGGYEWSQSNQNTRAINTVEERA